MFYGDDFHSIINNLIDRYDTDIEEAKEEAKEEVADAIRDAIGVLEATVSDLTDLL